MCEPAGSLNQADEHAMRAAPKTLLSIKMDVCAFARARRLRSGALTNRGGAVLTPFGRTT
jgi:hypothetical protein